MTLVEVVVATGLVAVMLLASAAAMGESAEATDLARRLDRGAVFLESVHEDLSTLAPADLPAMHGQTVHGDADSDAARFRAEITVFDAGPGLQQVEVALVDQVTGRTVARLHTLRADA